MIDTNPPRGGLWDRSERCGGGRHRRLRTHPAPPTPPRGTPFTFQVQGSQCRPCCPPPPPPTHPPLASPTLVPSAHPSLPRVGNAGTRDFYPEDMRLRNWLFGEFAATSRAFGFEQFDAPVLESEELFVRKAGEEITDQLYNFEVRCPPPPGGAHHARNSRGPRASMRRFILAGGRSRARAGRGDCRCSQAPGQEADFRATQGRLNLRPAAARIPCT